MKFKYTDYIINGKIVDVESLVTGNKYTKIITIPIASTVAVVGIVILLGFLPMTITMDTSRQIKLLYVSTKRKYNVNYIFLIPIDKLDDVLRKLHIQFSLHRELRRNEQNMKLGLLRVRSRVKDIFLVR